MIIGNEFFESINPDINHFNVLFPDLNSDRNCSYHNYESFNREICKRSTDLGLFHMNVRSITSKMDDFVNMLGLTNCVFEIICITETWLSNENDLNMIAIEGYEPLHQTRDGRGGGVSIFVINTVKTKRLECCCFCLPFIEVLTVECIFGAKKFMVVNIYRPPTGDIESFFDKLEFILSRLPTCDEKFIAGDFNINLNNVDVDPNSLNFMSIMHANSFIPVITRPTRIEGESQTLIDNIFVTKPDDIKSGNLICSLSDHFPNFLIHLNLLSEPSSDPISYQSRVLNDESLNHFYHSLINYDLSHILNSTDIDSALCNLYDILMNFYNIHCPIRNRTKSYKSKMKPWINSNIVELIKKRQNLYILSKRGVIRKDTFNRYRNYVTSMIRTAKKYYYEKKFADCRTDMKKTWHLINDIIRPGCRREADIEVLESDGVKFVNPVEIAQALNSHFSSVGSKIADDFCNETNFLPYLTGNFPNSFLFVPTTPSSIDSIIKKLKNKSCSIHCLPTSVLKYISNIVSPILSTLINRSVADGTFPNSLKLARVVPLFKGGVPSDVKNYRPISVLPLFSKVFEKAMYNQLYSYLEEMNILFKNQFGFRNGKSTSQSCNSLIQLIYDNLDRGRTTISIFLDFQKAFDCVDHRILLGKMYHYGIRGVVYNWFQSYLSNRSQYVYANKKSSSECAITHGVPQGSILGPLIFLIFINDFPYSSNQFSFNLFADDSTLTYSFDRGESNVGEVVNRELVLIDNWLSSNKIKINISKTNYIVFTLRSTVSIPPITIGGREIARSDCSKFLGLYVDEHLRFDRHVTFLSKKISKSVGILNRVKHFLPNHVLINLYYSLIYPYMLYVIESWYGCSLTLRKKIEVLQKRSIRCIYNLSFNEHTAQYFRMSKIVTLEQLYKISMLVYIHKTIYDNYDEDLSIKLRFQVNEHSIATRFSDRYMLPIHRSTKYEKSLFYAGIKLWNNLPIDLKYTVSASLFKKKLKKLFC